VKASPDSEGSLVEDARGRKPPVPVDATLLQQEGKALKHEADKLSGEPYRRCILYFKAGARFLEASSTQDREVTTFKDTAKFLLFVATSARATLQGERGSSQVKALEDLKIVEAVCLQAAAMAYTRHAQQQPQVRTFRERCKEVKKLASQHPHTAYLGGPSPPESATTVPSPGKRDGDTRGSEAESPATPNPPTPQPGSQFAREMGFLEEAKEMASFANAWMDGNVKASSLIARGCNVPELTSEHVVDKMALALAVNKCAERMTTHG